MDTAAEIKYAKLILSKTKPDSSMSLVKVASLTGMSQACVYAGLRWLRLQGLAQVETRVRNKAGPMVYLYKKAIPKAERDKPLTRTRNTAKNPSVKNGISLVTKWHIPEGDYTAQELKNLARLVIRTLGGKVTMV